MKRPLLLALISILAGAAAFADVTTSITAFGGLGFPQGESVTGFYAGLASVDFNSPRDHKNVKGQVSLNVARSNLYPVDLLSLDRAWIKVRLPWFRITAGKTRLSWGNGSLFNAGDLLFGSTDLAVDLTGDELRTTGAWLGSVYLPIPFVGPFTYIEGVVIPPALDETDLATIQGMMLVDTVYTALGTPPSSPAAFPTSLPASDGGVGFRFSSEPLGVGTEAGYFFDGSTGLHRAYLSLQGAIYVDLYASISTSADDAVIKDLGNRNDEFLNGLYENLTASAGLLQQFTPAYGHTLSARLEAIVRPDGQWNEQSPSTDYALYLYPELAWTPPGSWNVFLRSIISPVDVSAQITGGLTWKVTQGLDFLMYVSGNAGEADDTYPWGATTVGATNMLVTFGMKYTF